MRKVCAKMVPNLLSKEHKERRDAVSKDIIERLWEESDLLKNVIRRD